MEPVRLFQPFRDKPAEWFRLPATANAPADGLRVYGLAAPWGSWSMPAMNGKRYLFHPGAFQKSIDEQRTLFRPVYLLQQHQQFLPLATSFADGFRVWEANDGLRFETTSREVIGLAMCHPSAVAGVSVGGHATQLRRTVRPGGGELIEAFEFCLTEISLTPFPSFSETWVRVDRNESADTATERVI